MKKLFVATSFLFLSILGFSQDVIIRYDGSELVGKVVDITPTQVKYRGVDTNDIYEVDRSDIFMIRYEDGQEMLMNEIVGINEVAQVEINEIAQKRLNNVAKLELKLYEKRFFLRGYVMESPNNNSAYSLMKNVGAPGAYLYYLLGRGVQIIGNTLMYGGPAVCLASIVVMLVANEDTRIYDVANAGASAGFCALMASMLFNGIGIVMTQHSFKIYESKRNDYLRNNNLSSVMLSYGLTSNGIGFTLRF